MEVHAEREDGILITRAEGRVDGNNAREFEEALSTAIGKDDRLLILDLQDLAYISSAGLRVLLMVAKEFQRRGGKLVVCSLTETINEVFEISGFSKIIPTHTSRADALARHGG